MKKTYLSLSCSAYLLLAGCSSSENPENPGTEDTTAKPAANSNEKIKDGAHFFNGLIDHKYNINLKFVVYKNDITGSYYYLSQKKELELRGKTENGKIELDEFVNEKNTGHFSGIIYATDSATGIWKSPKGKELSFSLIKSFESDYEAELTSTKKSFTGEEINQLTAKSKKMELPFEYTIPDSYADHLEKMEDKTVRKFINEEYYPEENNFGYTYFYGMTCSTGNFTAVLYHSSYFPGAFGISNLELWMMTFDKNGNLISHELLGCNCLDTNMGSNDYFASSDTFMFTKDQIRVKTKNTHATLIETEGEESFENVSENKSIVKISTAGEIITGR